jgi:hypothetical protein
MKVYLNTRKTIPETMQDLEELLSDLGAERWYYLPDDSGPGCKVRFLFQGKWISASSTLQPTREGNLRMCYRALHFLREMEVRGVTSLVHHLATEMGLVPVGDDHRYTVEHVMLGVSPDATAEEIKRAFREKAKLVHPDAGGNADLFKALEQSYRKLLAERGVRNG